MKFGKTIFFLRCPYHSCKRVLGEVDDSGRVRTKSKRAGIDVILLFATLMCTHHGTEINWKSHLVSQPDKGM